MWSMVQRISTVAAAVAAAALLVTGSALASRVVKVGSASNGKSIVLFKDDRLVVSLPGNATTGYAWRVRALKSSVVRFVSRSYVPKQALPGKVGAGGTYILRFRSVTPGTTTLVLVYTQAGNTKAKAASKYTLHLAVKLHPQPA